MDLEGEVEFLFQSKTTTRTGKNILVQELLTSRLKQFQFSSNVQNYRSTSFDKQRCTDRTAAVLLRVGLVARCLNSGNGDVLDLSGVNPEFRDTTQPFASCTSEVDTCVLGSNVDCLSELTHASFCESKIWTQQWRIPWGHLEDGNKNKIHKKGKSKKRKQENKMQETNKHKQRDRPKD